ncbi:MAG: dUTP diphosphatase [Treponemataceae bacterium]|nr:dUTP diphosphatase [Spirochaetales bacterium]MDY6031454.1 dUTP diphosphatase [Treponemataceae bacterium]
MATELKFMVKKGAKVPVYKTSGAAGADVCACIETPVILKPFERTAVPTGLFFEIPEGYEIQVRPRSGLALKNGIALVNAPGTIDSDYRGELCVILINLGTEDFTIHNGDRIAQIVLSPVLKASFIEVSSISVTERGENGFGSTGVSGN